MASINFIGGEKGGVGKSVTARVLAQYFIDKAIPFSGFDTDRSHQSFRRFYAEYASPVVVDSFEGLDAIGSVLESRPGQPVIVDLAAQTSAPLSRWIQEASLFEVFAELGVQVNFWHVMDDGADSVELLRNLVAQYGPTAHYIIVKNRGRGSNFSQMETSLALQEAKTAGASCIELPRLHDGAMRKIDQHDMSFWKAANDRESDNALGMMDRQRVKTWLRHTYEVLSQLPI